MKFILMLVILLGLNPFFSFSAENNNVERIQVTGSRIKRINIEGPSPLLILDKEDLENSGYNSVADVLRDTNIAPFGVARESTGGSIAGEAFTGVHGASALILINGRRVIEDPNAEAVDLHLIPIYAVERIEIIKDGSSAIYGSNALGGVINFIMKENFSGTGYYGRISPTLYPFYKGGHRLEGAVVWGNTHPRGSVTGALQFRLNDSIFASDRKWSIENISPTSVHPAIHFEDSRISISDSCPVESRKETECSYNFSEYIHTLPQIAQFSGYIQGDYKWKGMNLYSQILSSYKRTSYQYPPQPGAIPLDSGHKLSTHTGVKGRLIYRFKESGFRMSLTDYLTMDTAFGAKGYLSSNWDWDANVKISGTYKKDNFSGLLVKDTIIKLVNEGIYDPYNSSQRDLSEAMYKSIDHNSSVLLSTDLIFSGNIGAVDTAFGVQQFYKNYTEEADPKVKSGNILGNAGSDGSGSRKISSFFGEATYSPFDSFEIQLAGRGDYYFDLNRLAESEKNKSNGVDESEDNKSNELDESEDNKSIGVFTFNPKVAFRYQPRDSFLLRGSIGTSFTAPSLHSLYGSKSEGFSRGLIDYIACFNQLKASGDISDLQETLVKDFLADQQETIEKKDLPQESKTKLEKLVNVFSKREYCNDRQYHVEIKNNKNLKEIKGLSASLGSVIQINEDISFTLDGWYIKTNGSPGNGISEDTIKVELKKGKDFVAKQGIIINRDSTNPYKPILNSRSKEGLPGIDAKTINMSSSEISGLDFALLAFLPDIHYRGGNFYVKEEGSVIFYSKSEGFPGRGFKDNIGKFGLPRWRTASTLGWKNKNHNMAFKLNSFASVTKLNNQLESLPMHHRLDISYQWAIDSKTIVNAGWINILFNDPPIDNTIKNDPQIDEDLYEIRGPHFYVGFKKLI